MVIALYLALQGRVLVVHPYQPVNYSGVVVKQYLGDSTIF